LKKTITPGLYWFHNHQNKDGGRQHTGSQLTLTWSQIQPYAERFDWSRIDNWLSIERQLDHKWVLRIDVHQNRGARSLPGWAPALQLKLKNGHATTVPNYANATLHHHMVKMIQALGQRYDTDQDLVLVQIALGLYGETHPERDDSEGNLASELYNSKALTACQWITYCKTIINAYAEAFPNTELVIMNAPTFNYPCRGGPPFFTQTWPRPEIDDFALAAGVGAQNNSLDEWDANWFTCEVVGKNGKYTIRGSVGPFVEAGRLLAFERGSWLRPYPLSWSTNDFQTWWSYLNGLSKGARIIFPPNWPGKVLVEQAWMEYPAGVWLYPEAAPYAQELSWMNDFALKALRGELWFWAAFDAPKGQYWYDTAQHTDHELGIHCLTPMASEWEPAHAKPPFYESKYMRKLSGPCTFQTTPGRYNVTLWFKGHVSAFGKDLTFYDWHSKTFEESVPAEFTVSGNGYLHAIILEPAGSQPPQPPEPPTPPEPEKETYTITLKDGRRLTITIE